MVAVVAVEEVVVKGTFVWWCMRVCVGYEGSEFRTHILKHVEAHTPTVGKALIEVVFVFPRVVCCAW